MSGAGHAPGSWPSRSLALASWHGAEVRGQGVTPRVAAVWAGELAAAGIHDPVLRASYRRCRELHARHGRTYFLATRLLPPAKRPYVHALYGFARYADEIVDDHSDGRTPAQRAEHLASWGESFLVDAKAGRSTDPVGAAVVDTLARWDIPLAHVEAFLSSMAMDLTVTEYPTWADLYRYVYGSSAVIGLEMVPILGPLDGAAYDHAQDLGLAFQLANFVRDVGEDLDRGRLYLPLEDLERFGLCRADLERRVVDDRVRELLAFEVARVRRLAEQARPGIALLAPSSRPCIEAALVLYCGIADEVERRGFDVFAGRASVPVRRRVAVAAPAWVRALSSRRRPT
jgi:15-cis-phytoene synthase